MSGATAATGPGSPDFRLAAMALATWASAYLVLHTSALVAAIVAGVAAAGVAGLWRWVGPAGSGGPAAPPADAPAASNGAAWVGVGVAVLLGVVCGSAATGARLAARDAAPVATLVGERARVTVELTVRDDPFPLDGRGGAPPSWMVRAWLDRVEPDRPAAPLRVRARIIVFAPDPAWRPLLPGQRVRADGRLGPPRGGDLTAAVLSATGPPELLGEPPWPQRAAGSLRAGLQAAATPLPDQPGGLLPGLAVGDVSNLDPAVSEDFRATGLTHLLAVSGSNVAIVTGFVILLARACRAPPGVTAVLSGLALVGFVILCRADASVLRAGVMGAIALVALASGRRRAALPALGAAVIVLVVADPQLAADPGFLLSVLATAGLLLLAPRWRDGLRRRRVPPGLAEALAVPAAAQVAVAPVIAGLSGTVSLVAVSANLVATLAVAPVTVLGVLAAAVSPGSAPAAEFLAWLASWPAWWLVLVARYGSGVPGAVVPWPAGVAGALLLAALTIAFLAGLRSRLVRRLVAVATVAVVVGALPVRVVTGGWPPDGAVVVACAVGQGDLVVLPVRAGAAIVVDTGPDPAAADRCLRDLGVRTVSLLVISHYHDDHVAGIAGVFRDRPVAAVLAPAWTEPEAGRVQVAAAATESGTPVHAARAGTAYQVGEVSLAVIGPRGAQAGTRSDPNNNSIVIRATVRGVAVLLTGDAEVELQRALLAQAAHAGLRAEVLKVPHHGSPYQEPAFLDAVDPRVALVTVGPDNTYGHPHPPLLDRLAGGGARVLRTDRDGDVAAVLDDGALAVVTRGPPPGSRSRRPPRGRTGARIPGSDRGRCRGVVG